MWIQICTSQVNNIGLQSKSIHTSGHATVKAIKDIITGLNPKRIIPIHTFEPETFLSFSDKVTLEDDGQEIKVGT